MTEYSSDTRGGPVEHQSVPTRAAVFVPTFKSYGQGEGSADGGDAGRRSADARLEEACGLARAIDLDIRASGIVTGQRPRPATLIGAGKVEDMKAVVASEAIGLVVIDHPLTPVQQRNLETELNAKVLDRTGLILEIFGERAQTKEGRLQVDLAHLTYQRGRLVRSWTHLERQRGGAGFLGGPGETQIESDRRQLQERIKRLEKDLEQVRRTRTLHRSKRQKVPNPVVALVGYTNAGKSTLFNQLTGADVFVENLLFATLDPTMRRTTLPHGTEVLFSDTVGFVSDLPTHLVAAFRATLEEVVEADLVLHVRDMSDPDASAQAEDVRKILRDLDVDADDEDHVIEVWNKIDKLSPEEMEVLSAAQTSRNVHSSIHLVSAADGTGIENLKAEIERRIAGRVMRVTLNVEPTSMELLSWLYENASVESRRDEDDGSATVTVEITAQARRAYQQLQMSRSPS